MMHEMQLRQKRKDEIMTVDFEKVLRENKEKWENREYIFEKKNGVYEAVTYGAFIDKTRAFAKYMLNEGYQGKNILLYGANCINLMVADLAVLHYVGTGVCVSKEWKYDDIYRAIKMLDVPCVIYGEDKAEVIDEIRKAMPELRYIALGEIDELAEEMKAKSEALSCIPQSDEACCKIIFSSGTTAKPKAVMLCKRNIFAGVPSLLRRCPFNETDVDYLFLPLSHTYGGIYNFLYGLVSGFSIYLCSSVNEMAQEILEVNPTIFCGVPAIYRRFYEGYGEHIAMAFGPNIKYLFCGGACLDEDIRKAYKNSGLSLMDAYGLSETASTFSIQYPDDLDCKCVGTIAEEIEVIVLNPDENGIGEIAVRGDNVFLGYAKDEELTKSLFTEDGFFRTGDMGYLLPDEEHGSHRLYLTGRIKKILLGENGENVEPTHIEKLICEKNSNINKALIYMQDNILSCHVYLLDREERDWEKFFEEINAGLPSYEKVRRFDVVIDSVERRLKQ